MVLARQGRPLPPPFTGPSATPGGASVNPPSQRRRFPGQSLTIAALPYFLLPEDDPWDDERWRRLGERPEPHD